MEQVPLIADTRGFPTVEELEADPLVELAIMPWRVAEAAHDLYVAWCQHAAWFCLRPLYPPHPHEAPNQLEIPDPLAAENEHDLFA